jgi:hypothetical protein
MDPGGDEPPDLWDQTAGFSNDWNQSRPDPSEVDLGEGRCIGVSVYRCFGHAKGPVRSDRAFSANSKAKELWETTGHFSPPKHRAEGN